MVPDTAIPVVVAFRNRPIYLWNCLDALFRLTRTPARFLLVDNASEDPLVPQVIRSFERRGMIAGYTRMDHNDPGLLIDYIMERLPGFGEHFVYVEGDAVIEDQGNCWLAEMSSLMRDNPRLAMLGASIDRRDFVELDTARALEPERPEDRLAALIKLNSPERLQVPPDDPDIRIFSPHNPAGRVMMLRCDALKAVGIGEDYTLHNRFVAAGYETGIAVRVRHRHMSLLNIFDYEDYDIAGRNTYMANLNR